MAICGVDACSRSRLCSSLPAAPRPASTASSRSAHFLLARTARRARLTSFSAARFDKQCNAAPAPFETATGTSTTRLPTATDLTTLKLPPLHCPFPSLVNPEYLAVKEACDAWIEALAEPPSASASSFLHDCLFPLLVCRFIPKSISQHRLVHVIKAISWLMIADDDDDHPDMLGSDHGTTSRRADLVMAILRDVNDKCGEGSSFDCSFLTSICPSLATKSARMLKALAELWQEMRQEMPPSLRARFISTMANYFEGIKVQASFREKAIIPNVDSYMKIRRQASFTIPCFILMEYALGIELDDNTFYNPLLQELHYVALDYISLCNDVVSCRIEIQNGDRFNLPSILYNMDTSQWHSTTFQNVMDHVSQMIEDLNNRAIFLTSNIHKESKNFSPAMVPSIHTYVEGLSRCMSGAIAWFLETARYQHAN